MAKKVKLEYYRNTTFNLTHVYQKNGVPSTDGQTLFFTVKPTQYDTSTGDTTALISKTISMSGANTTITINPTDLADTVAPGTYYFDIKVKESNGPPPVIYQCAAGEFILLAEPTNRES